MIEKTRLLIVAFSLGLALVSGAAGVRAAESDPPEILAVDLPENFVSKSDKLTVTFLVVSGASVKTIRINGEEQKFESQDTVQVTKDFTLSKGRTIITVLAEGQEGGTRERKFTVYYEVEAAKPWVIGAHGEVRFEVDSNPTNDVGLPFTVSGLDVKGTIPASKRPDTRTTGIANVSATRGGLSLTGGGLDQEYSKSDNTALNAALVYGGVGYRFETSKTTAWLTNYTYSQLAIGNTAYNSMHTVAGAYERQSSDGQYARRHRFELDVTYKDFASSSQTDGAVGILKWEYLRYHPTNLSSFLSVVQAGTASEGDKTSDYNFVGGDWDWANRWESGFRWDIGFGYQYRGFPNDKQPVTTQAGSTRLDNLFRVSTGAGWQWNPRWSAMLNYRYLTDLSNKEPYVREIYGIYVIGNF